MSPLGPGVSGQAKRARGSDNSGDGDGDGDGGRGGGGGETAWIMTWAYSTATNLGALSWPRSLQVQSYKANYNIIGQTNWKLGKRYKLDARVRRHLR